MTTTRKCLECGKEFQVVLEAAKYCSYDCEIAGSYVEMKFTTAEQMMKDSVNAEDC